MKTFSMKTWLLGLMSLVFAFGCNNDKDGMDGNSSLSVHMVDAPADYAEVWVEVLGVEVLPAGEVESDGSAWVNIGHESENKHLNLMDLVGDNQALIGSTEIQAGVISQIRLILGEDNYLITHEGERVELTTPSAQQSGLKLQLNQELKAGIEYDIILDFDAAQSIVEAAESQMVILKPVLRIVAEGSASIRGTLSPAVDGALVQATSDGEVFTTATDENGVFLLRGLEAASFNLEIDPGEGYEDIMLEGIQTVSGEVNDLGTLELTAVVEVEVDVEVE